MCLPGVNPEKLNVTLSRRTLRTLVGFVETARLAARTTVVALTAGPPLLLCSVAVSVALIDPGPVLERIGAVVEATNSPSDPTVAVVDTPLPLMPTVLPGMNPVPEIVI